MTQVRGAFVVGVLALAGVLALTHGGNAGGKDGAWKEFLSEKDAKELSDRARADLLEALDGTPDADAVKRAQFLALTIAGMARSVSGGDAAKRGEVYQNYLHVANLLGQKGKAAEVRKMVEKGTFPAAKGGFDGDLTKSGADIHSLMEHYKTKAKGGEGVHPSLQSNIKLKGALNGIEEKIRAVMTKKLLPGVLEKEAEELALLALRAAVVGEIVHEFAPVKKVGMKDPAEWRKLSVAVRDTGIDLAAAARKQDVDGVYNASNKMSQACNQCHSTFRLLK